MPDHKQYKVIYNLTIKKIHVDIKCCMAHRLTVSLVHWLNLKCKQENIQI